MNQLVPAALLGWLPLTLLLFFLMSVRRAVVVSCVGGWLLLPVASLSIPGLPDWTKEVAVSSGILIGLAIRRPQLLLDLRPSLVDLPMLAWCTVPFASSMTNGLGPYDGASATLDRMLDWGLFWIAGRAVFRRPEHLREIVLGVVVGALAYVPACVLEMAISPQLHRIVYGYHQHQFLQSMRGGGWRPTVFLNHGLMVGLWMAAGAVASWCLWRSRRLPMLLLLPPSMTVAVLWLTLVGCRSAGAIVLAVGSVAVFEAWRATGRRLVPATAVLVVPAFLAVRIAGGWNGGELVDAVAGVSSERAASLAFRFDNEDALMERAAERPLVGWGGWGRMRAIEERDEVVTDSLWIIAYGSNGLVGLAGIFGALVLPVLRLARRVPREWRGTPAADGVALAAVLLLFAIDSLVNAMPNPAFLVAAGALAGMSAPRWRAKPGAAGAGIAPTAPVVGHPRTATEGRAA